MTKWFCGPNLRTDKVMSPSEAGYFAGFTDGEGTIGVYRVRRKEYRCGYKYLAVLRLCSTDFSALEAIRTMCGNGLIREVTRPKNPNYKTGYVLTFTANQLRHILPQVIPFLHIKKRQAELTMEYLSTITPGRNISGDQTIAVGEMYAATRRMNAKGPRGLVAVN